MPCSGASLYGLESSDSLALEDSVRFAEPEGGRPDTLPMRPEGPTIRDTVWSDSIGIERLDPPEAPH
jgi:hypothetical protein